MEKTAIFKAALRLLKEGKFHGTSMAEIALHADLTGSTVASFFRSRTDLITELSDSIFDDLIGLIRKTEGSLSFEKNFFNIWRKLFDYYVQNPEIITFIDRLRFMPKDLDQSKKRYDEYIETLQEFFESFPDRPSNEMLTFHEIAVFYHENILGAAKMQITAAGKDPQELPERISKFFWKSLFNQAYPSDRVTAS